ncbi:MAG: hypothetical protein ABH879_10695 [archaeon]
MAFLNFGGKKEGTPYSGMQGAPADNSSLINRVAAMRNQGLTDHQTVTQLQNEGVPPDVVFDAINQLNLGPSGAPPMQPQPEQFQEPRPAPQAAPQQTEPDSERIEEITEAIIDEKWKELTRHIDKIIDWKERTEQKVALLEQDFSDLKKNFDSLHNAILGKIGEYDENIVSLGAEIKAMEKVFQKLLPTFTENVSELSRITKKLKS